MVSAPITRRLPGLLPPDVSRADFLDHLEQKHD
jgi:hypothetical protein